MNTNFCQFVIDSLKTKNFISNAAIQKHFGFKARSSVIRNNDETAKHLNSLGYFYSNRKLNDQTGFFEGGWFNGNKSKQIVKVNNLPWSSEFIDQVEAIMLKFLANKDLQGNIISTNTLSKSRLSCLFPENFKKFNQVIQEIAQWLSSQPNSNIIYSDVKGIYSGYRLANFEVNKVQTKEKVYSEEVNLLLNRLDDGIDFVESSNAMKNDEQTSNYLNSSGVGSKYCKFIIRHLETNNFISLSEIKDHFEYKNAVVLFRTNNVHKNRLSDLGYVYSQKLNPINKSIDIIKSGWSVKNLELSTRKIEQNQEIPSAQIAAVSDQNLIDSAKFTGGLSKNEALTIGYKMVKEGLALIEFGKQR